MVTHPVLTNGLTSTTLEVLGNLAPLVAELVVTRDNDVLLFLSPLSSFDIWVQNIVPTVHEGGKQQSGEEG